MKIVAVANRKGGVGKSTTSVHIAGSLAARGHRVLLIDTDPQGHAGVCLGIRKEPGLYNLIVEKANYQDVLRPVPPTAIMPEDRPPSGRLLVLPSDEKTQVIPMLAKNPFEFKERLQEVQEIFDFVIIDTAPTVTMFDGAIYLAVEAFLYVTECEKLSLDGLNSGLRQIEEFDRQRQTPLHVLGILPNKLREKTANHIANLSAVRERFGDLVWEPIAQRTTLSEATNFGQLVFAYAPDSEAAQAMWAMVDKFEEAVGEWQKSN